MSMSDEAFQNHVVGLLILFVITLLVAVASATCGCGQKHKRHSEPEREVSLYMVKKCKTVAQFVALMMDTLKFEPDSPAMVDYTLNEPRTKVLGDRIRANLLITTSSVVSISINEAEYDQSFEDFVLGMCSACQVFVLVHLNNADRAQQSKDAFFEKANKIIKGSSMLLPTHRFIFCSSLTGRVAAARQLAPAVVVEFNPEAAGQLAPHVGATLLVTEDMSATVPPGVRKVGSYINVLVTRI